MSASGFNITAVERDTGLSKDVLRMWERRYGFPLPERDAHGERVYSTAQVERLRLIKRLMDQGHRPGKLVGATAEELARLAPRRPPAAPAPAGAECLDSLLDILRQHDVPAFQQAMQQQLARQGLSRFVLDTVAPLSVLVGQAWEEGRFEIFEEHLFTEQTKRLLRQAIGNLPPGRGGPRIMLTSVPEEQHLLGLLMAEALFALEGATCISLGTQMPLPDIQRAAAAHRADVVALSFSMAYPSRQIPSILLQLRSMLPMPLALWVGGGATARFTAPPGVELIPDLEAAVTALAAWRQRQDSAVLLALQNGPEAA